MSLLLVAVLTTPAAAGPAIDFERQIAPLLRERCVSCHGPDKQKGGLRLDTRAHAFRGGDGGPVLVPSKPEFSELYRRIVSTEASQRMPPGKKPLSAAEIDLLRRWLAAGASWPQQPGEAVAQDRRLDHWAWQPVRPVAPPTVATPARLHNPIDAFIVTTLRQRGLRQAPEADRRTLIRRVMFDLVGLPPTPEEVAAFETDPDPRAYEKLVDRLLASPAHGERWARHWLDIAHYADTHGFERDQRRDHAWRYRDWVIQALNADLPYDRFLRDQLAGDVLRPDDPDAVAATGFLAAGPWDFVGQAETPSPVLKRQARADDLDDMVTQVMTATCGVTIHCARCHDHKLDPISQREYYSLWAVFAGVKRGNRPLSRGDVERLAQRRATLEQQLTHLRRELNQAKGQGWSLADIVGGGDGTGSGKPGLGIDPRTGKPQSAKRGFLDGAETDRFVRSTVRYVDGVVIPRGGDAAVPISSTGLVVRKVPRTSGRAWDAIRNGAVNSQFSTKLGGIDFAEAGQTLLGLHANAAITFDLSELRKAGLPDALKLRGVVGYFGQTPRKGASVQVLVDGAVRFERLEIGRDDGLFDLEVPLPPSARFLTLMATDAGNDIGHDQLGFGNLRLESAAPGKPADAARIEQLTRKRDAVQQELARLSEPAQVYAVVSETPPTVHVLTRGNPEQPRDLVTPGTISCVSGLKSPLGDATLPEGERRVRLAQWITDPVNPLTRRVIVNRLWQHHFGAGLVDTPSDFGLGGGAPSHPELLDWLAGELGRDWSLKRLHRLICLSATYRQASVVNDAQARGIDASNRLLWRQNPRRLDAESLRDAVLAVSGSLNRTMGGPGYRDFDYKEEYAPVYTYIVADRPELWRRSIYRFVVRTTPHQFLTTLDCPDPANLTPTRSVTTTALQALALLNDAFMVRQAGELATRVRAEAGESAPAQVRQLFARVLGRAPSADEEQAASGVLSRHGLAALSRFLLNANEFVTID
ncbi:MAG: DUF1553 domain-containing protein [Gemmataceae bacterium]